MYKKFNVETKSKTLFLIIALILMLTSPMLMMSVPAAEAADYDTYAYLALSTNPLGVNQNVVVVCWLSLPPPTAFGIAGEQWENLTVTITTPEGNTETKGPYSSDAIGQIYFSYVPTEIGSYQFQFHFPGQLSQNGNYYNPSDSPIVSLTVQQEQVEPYPYIPLPDSNTYWERPINGQNLLWTTFSGNWLGLGSASFGSRAFDSSSNYGNFNPYTAAPNTAHIVWTKENGFGGIIGGEYNDPPTYYTGNSYEAQFTPPVIINGVLYYNTAIPPKYGFQAVDLRTGQTLWFQNSTGQQPDPQICTGTLGGIYWPGITNGQVLNYITENQYGGIPYLWNTAGSVWSMYDAFTGNWILNLANASVSSPNFVTDETGTLFTYQMGDDWIAMWNSTKAVPTSTTIPGYRTWRPVTGSTTDWRNGLEWNVTLDEAVPGQSIARVSSDIILATSSRDAAPGTRLEIGYDAKTGEQLWVENRTHLIPGSNNYNLQGPMAEGVYTEYVQEEQAWYGFSALTGEQLWGPTEATSNAWSMYNTGSAIAYGTLYSLCFDGLHAYDLATGAHLWDFAALSSGVQTIYGIWPFDLGSFTIADGKVYIAVGHSHGVLPQFADAEMFCINATTGDVVFSVLGWMQDGWTNAPAVADGYLVTENGYDKQIYCFGKGQTETTVSYESVIGSSTSVLIKGSVTDQSPGDTCLGIPAAGTPAISDECMSDWMEYLYMQQPKPTDATGVSVHLTAIDPNGNFQDIGTVTSDMDGNFAVEWTPPVPGVYTVKASFDGSGSYFMSYGTTSFAISEPPAASSSTSSQLTPTPPQTTTASPPVSLTPTTQTEAPQPSVAPQPSSETPVAVYITIAAAIIAIIVVAAAIALKRHR
ncbi:MAG: PQQ-binding-like beta-propeller repeat protein [Candidatus Bathyarchaeota archaeon]|nr:PQQ-binding-like beta-propeller repeat protein [Candidatus Bathyarchaeota archaeon]